MRRALTGRSSSELRLSISGWLGAWNDILYLSSMEMMKKFRKVSYEVSNKRVKRAYQPYLHLSSIALFSDNIAGADLLTESPTAGFRKIWLIPGYV
jgi:hypothetical protein